MVVNVDRVRRRDAGSHGGGQEVAETGWARTVDGACIAYHDLGAGPLTLVVIHGWASRLEICRRQPRFARFTSRLAKNMRVPHFDKCGVAGHIGALAEHSGVLVSPTVKDLVGGSGLLFEDRREHTLKGVPDPWHLWAVKA